MIGAFLIIGTFEKSEPCSVLAEMSDELNMKVRILFRDMVCFVVKMKGGH